MFGKESEMRPDESKLSTIIARGTKIIGNISMEGSLRIDGYVKGKVSSTETLTVGKTGEVDGEVSVKEAVIGGKIRGNMVANQRVELESKASILGDVKTRIFVIKEGGIFHGNCSMQEGEKAKDKGLAKGDEPNAEAKIPPPSARQDTSKSSGTLGSTLGKI
jgi:cytoskeletal protein CcmA (bactofilin family)